LDLRFHCIVISSCDGVGKNDGTPAGEIRRMNECQCKSQPRRLVGKKGRQIGRNKNEDGLQEKAKASMAKFEGKMEETMEHQMKHFLSYVDQSMKNFHRELMETIETTEPDPRMMPSAEEHQDIPNREATVMPIRELRKRQRVHNLAMKCRQKKQDKTRETC
jgi:hypothetical protein